MREIIKASPNPDVTGEFKGSIPNQDRESQDPVSPPLNLSVLAKYIEGFTFKDAEAIIHVRGPNSVMDGIREAENPQLYFAAVYWGDDETDKQEKPIYPKRPLILERDPLLLDEGDFDANGSYNKKNLPENRNAFDFSDEFLGVMNDHPKRLYFDYEFSLPEILTVTPDDFEDNSTTLDNKIGSKITTTIMIMLPLALKVAEPGPGIIKVPEMFKEDAVDLFGREEDDEESIFDSIEIDHLKLSIDLIESFFNGGKLFLEQEPKLFPDGISLSGKKMVLYISGENYEIVKNNLIPPEFRVVFEKSDADITVPRHIGLDNIKFEAKGKYEFQQ
jgi:hypothetical protein